MGNVQQDIFSIIERPAENIILQSIVDQDEITREIEKVFDYSIDKGTVTETISLPKFPKDFEIGLIYGSSGSGKSTLLKKCFGEEEPLSWDQNKSIASHFSSAEEASKKFGAVGLNSIPTWIKPYDVLSNGERFRADLARKLKNGARIDEFTSVVNREVAISCSVSIEKYIRNNKLHNIVFCSCHDDIIPYLKPDWVYNTDTHEFYSGRYLRQQKTNIEILCCDSRAWRMFQRHHYLSGDLNKASRCYIAVQNDIPVGFISLLSFPSKNAKHAWREHRLVVLPDYQGRGIGNKLSETVAQFYIEKGCRYFSKTSNPRMGEHREKSPLWRPTTYNKKARSDYILPNGKVRDRVKMREEMGLIHAKRICYAHEYIGDGTKYEYIGINNVSGQEQLNLFDYGIDQAKGD